MTDHNRPFSDDERHGLYRAIYECRDVRSQFLPESIPAKVLACPLDAAHYAPSVGFMQPWDFIVLDSTDVRQAILTIFEEEDREVADNYQGNRNTKYKSLKL